MERFVHAGTGHPGVSRASRVSRVPPPAPLPTLIVRPRLMAALDAAPGSVLLTAPAGFGKTTLLHQWAQASACPSIWINGADPRHHGAVWPAVMAGLRESSVISPAALDALEGTGSSADAALSRLCAALGDRQVRLVFDDIDVFSTGERDYWLPELLNRDAYPVQSLATTRNAAAVNAGPARLSGRLLDLFAADLAFTGSETEELACLLAPQVGVHSVDKVHQHHGGWPACTVLALRSLRQSADGPLPPDGLRPLTEYLERDILPTLNEAEAHLLAGTAVCHVVSATQAEGLSGRPDAGWVLTGLTTRGLVEPAGPGTFRTRSVLRDYFLDSLIRTDPSELHRLHGVAAHWHARAGDPAAALRHASASEDDGLVADVLCTYGVRLVASGRAALVLRALSPLDETAVLTNTALSLVAALAHLEMLEPVSAARFADAADIVWPGSAGEEVRDLRDLVRSGLGWFAPPGRAPSGGPAAYRHESPPTGSPHPDIRIEAKLLKTATAQAAGNFSAAETWATNALADAAALRNAHAAEKILTTLAFGAALRGQLRDAGRYLTQAGASGAERLESSGPERPAAHVVQALRALLRMEPASARELSAAVRTNLGQLESVPHGIGATLRAAAAVLDACALLDLGGGYRALNGLRRARDLLAPEDPFDQALAAWMAVTEHTAALALGDGRRAREVTDWTRERQPRSGELCLLRASGAAAISRFATASERLQPLYDGSCPPLLGWTWIQVSVLECAIAVRTGRRALAVEHLGRALHLSDELEVLRPLANGPAEVTDLLAERAGACGAEEETAERVLAVRPAAKRPHPLTPRQQEILSLLPSHLSLHQIAAELQVSVNTVKTHVKIIYAKLGVSSRHDAVTTAYRCGQLP